MPLFHGPDADHDPPADPEDARQLSERAHAPLRRGDVVDDGHAEDGVQALVAERERQVITVQNLGIGKYFVIN